MGDGRQKPRRIALEEIGAFAEAARANGVWLLIGSMAVKIGQRRAANRSYFFSPKGEIAHDRVVVAGPNATEALP